MNIDAVLASPARYLQKFGMVLVPSEPEPEPAVATTEVPLNQSMREEEDKQTEAEDTHATQQSSSPTENEVQDMPHLFEHIGRLTEEVKKLSTIVTSMSSMQTTMVELKNSVTKDMSELQARVLVNEEAIGNIHKKIDTLNSDMKHMKPVIKKLERGNLVDKLSTDVLEKVTNNESKISQLQQQMKEPPKDFMSEEQLAAIADHMSVSANSALSTYFVQLDDLDLSHKELQKRIVELENINTTRKNTPTTVAEKQPVKSSTSTSTYSSSKSVNDKSKSRKKEPAANITIDHDLIIIGDSNTKALNMRKLGAKSYRRRHRYVCYTIEHVVNFTKTAKIVRQPAKIVLHIGTNHVDKDNANILKQKYQEMLELVRERFPKSRIYLSSLFVRQQPEDPLNEVVSDVNKFIFNTCDTTPGISYLDNENIGHEDLIDLKHIDNIGMDTFINNIKHSVLGEAYEGYPTW